MTTITQVNRIAAWRAKQRRRSIDTRTYLHHCEQCGYARETTYADDDAAWCPKCSTHPLDLRIFRFWGNAGSDENSLIAGLALAACVASLWAFLAALA